MSISQSARRQRSLSLPTFPWKKKYLDTCQEIIIVLVMNRHRHQYTWNKKLLGLYNRQMKRSEWNECHIGHDMNFDKKKYIICSKPKTFFVYITAPIFLVSPLAHSKNLRLLRFGRNLAQVPDTETCQTNLSFNSFITFFHIFLVPFFIIVYMVVRRTRSFLV